MRKVINIGLAAFMLLAIGACEEKKPKTGPKEHKTIKIGEQIWMAENLDDPSKGGRCYDDKPENCKKYGRLYTHSEAESACPEGWHLPSDEEWQTLVDFAGGKEVAGAKLKSEGGWDDYEGKSGNGTDEYGFSALPGGFKSHSGFYHNDGGVGYWWGRKEKGGIWVRDIEFRGSTMIREIKNNGSDVGMIDPATIGLFSVRCVQGSTSIPKTIVICEDHFNKDIEYSFFTDSRDDQSYRSVKIGKQTWMAQNLNDPSNGGKCLQDKPENCDKYGRLYTWDEAMNACPEGWHLPSNEEWQTLVNFAGGRKVAGGKLKASSCWFDYEGESGNGTDKYGFSALPGGFGFDWPDVHYSVEDRIAYRADYTVGNGGNWWTSTESNSVGSAWRRRIDDDAVQYSGLSKNELYSVRCVQDSVSISECSDNVKLLESITKGGQTTKFEYDDKNRIVKMGTKTLTYKGDDLVIIDGTEYKRNGKVAAVSRDGSVVDSLTLDENGFVTIKMPQDEPSGVIYEFGDGNLTKLMHEEGSTEYKYDDKKSPFYNTNTPKWIIQSIFASNPLFWLAAVSKNNVLEENNNYTWNESESNKCSYKYEYDSDGFPTKRTMTRTMTQISGGNTETTTFTYCKQK